jgi:predicted CDP-diglyceride synthetase/phosphatidate cytidylyltransferase
MAQPKCGFCGNLVITTIKRKLGATDWILVICAKCGAVLGTAPVN